MSNIKVGDLVMVVKPAPCCGSNNSLGRVFTVGSREPKSKLWCPKCGHVSHRTDVHAVDVGVAFVQAERLIKIDPPALTESLEREKELSV
jgi:glutamate/tyrosine decarboxylase-like PLP-dependent enzyme